MKTNALPAYDASDNPTGCCPRFHPEGWDGLELHFEDKLFVKATTKSEQYAPVDMGSVFQKTFAAIEKAGAGDKDDFVVLSRDRSAVETEHYFSVAKSVPEQEMVRWSGDYLTKVFEGPYEESTKWRDEIVEEVERRGRKADEVYYFYTTCPKCAQTYGKNYVVAVAELADG